jgi:serine/threonine-protein kinase
MSPEQIEGQPVTARSDQFSLGITLMEMCCGRRPYDGETALLTMDRILQADAPDLGDLAAEVQLIIRRCLSREPERRFPSTEALQKAIAVSRQFWPQVSPKDLGAWVDQKLAPG